MVHFGILLSRNLSDLCLGVDIGETIQTADAEGAERIAQRFETRLFQSGQTNSGVKLVCLD